jgi:hypothetical protein
VSASDLEQIAERLDARDREYVSGLDPEQRDVVLSTMGRYMRSRGVAIGDPVPALGLSRLENGEPVRVDALVADRLLVLVFGSFT